MTTICVVTSGEYSGYHIEAMFSTSEKAMQYMDRRREYSEWDPPAFNEIEEYELDAVPDDYLAGKVKCWIVSIGVETADVTSVELEDGNPVESTQLPEVYPGRTPYPKSYVIRVFADTKERAIKVAMERRSVWLANQATEGVADE